MSDTLADDGPQEITLDSGEPEVVETPAPVEVTNEPQDKPADEPEPSEEKNPEDGRLRNPDGTFRRDAEAAIHRATFLRREAERQRDAAIAQLHRAQAGDDAAPKSKPTPDAFQDYGEYVEALTDWKVGERERTANETRAKEAAKSADEHRASEWGAKLANAKATIPDFDAVMEKADAPTLPHVANAIMDADRGPELLHHLASHPEQVARLNEMSPYRAAMELGRIEATLPSAPAPAKARDTTTTKAPTPITPVTAGASGSKDPSKMTMDEYQAYRKAQGIRY